MIASSIMTAAMHFSRASPTQISFQTCIDFLYLRTAVVAFALLLLDCSPIRANQEASLLPSTEIQSQAPNISGHHQTQIVAATVLLALQGTLIVWLLYEHRLRHNAEVATQHAMAQLEQLNRLATAGELSASIAHEVNQPLTGTVSRANAALCWLAGENPDIKRARAALTQIVSIVEFALPATATEA